MKRQPGPKGYGSKAGGKEQKKTRCMHSIHNIYICQSNPQEMFLILLPAASFGLWLQATNFVCASISYLSLVDPVWFVVSYPTTYYRHNSGSIFQAWTVELRGGEPHARSSSSNSRGHVAGAGHPNSISPCDEVRRGFGAWKGGMSGLGSRARELGLGSLS
jgi:hypothetical protein